jgi:hypothetical protein
MHIIPIRRLDRKAVDKHEGCSRLACLPAGNTDALWVSLKRSPKKLTKPARPRYRTTRVHDDGGHERVCDVSLAFIIKDPCEANLASGGTLTRPHAQVEGHETVSVASGRRRTGTDWRRH